MSRAEQLAVLHDYACYSNQTLTLFRDIFLHSTDATAILDRQGRYVDHNDAHRRLLGYSMDELKGKTLALGLNDETHARIEAALAGTGIFQGPADIRDHTGRARTVDLSIFTVRDETGVIVGRIAIKRDARPRRPSRPPQPSLYPAGHAQHRLQFLIELSNTLATSFDSSPPLATVAQLAVAHLADWCAIDMLNPDGTIRRLAIAHKDPQKARLAAELERLYPMDLDAPRGLPNVLRTGRSKLYPEVTDRALRSVARDPRHLAMLRELGLTSAMIVPLMARGQTLGGIRLAIADPGRRYTPADLAFADDLARHTALALDNARLYQEIRHVAEAAQSANASKDQFLAVLSHELRTPLTPVLTAAAALEQQTQLSPDIRSTAQMICRNVEIQAHLIDDLLDLTRITRGKLELTLSTLDAHEALRQTIQICQKNIQDKGLFLWLDLAARYTHVRADPARLQQVFWNLLNNATKFTPPGGRVTLRTRNTISTDNANSDAPCPALIIEISDSGIGIDSDCLPRLFHAFEQGQRSITRRFGGLGLGLTISKALIDAHDGQLTAASTGPNQGATFTIQLQTVPVPTTQPQMPDPAIPAHSAPTSHPPLRILLVEDHQDTAQIMARLLGGLGYDVQTAPGVGKALELAQVQEFDLLISDIGLPDGSGLELMRTLHQSTSIRGIALSGFGMELDLAQSKEAGFAEHLIKPINFQQLESVIAKVAGSCGKKTEDGRQ